MVQIMETIAAAEAEVLDAHDVGPRHKRTEERLIAPLCGVLYDGSPSVT